MTEKCGQDCLLCIKRNNYSRFFNIDIEKTKTLNSLIDGYFNSYSSGDPEAHAIKVCKYANDHFYETKNIHKVDFPKRLNSEDLLIHCMNIKSDKGTKLKIIVKMNKVMQLALKNVTVEETVTVNGEQVTNQIVNHGSLRVLREIKNLLK